MANRPMRTVYAFDGADFYHTSLTPPGENHWYTSRNTGDGQSGMVFNYGETGFAETPDYYLGSPFVVGDVRLGGELRGTDSTVKVEFASMSSSGLSLTGGLSHTFQERDRQDGHYRAFAYNSDRIDRLKLRFTLNRGTDSSRESPQPLPLTVGVYLLLDGKARTPAQCDPSRYGGK